VGSGGRRISVKGDWGTNSKPYLKINKKSKSAEAWLKWQKLGLKKKKRVFLYISCIYLFIFLVLYFYLREMGPKCSQWTAILSIYT
jgi:hypothetical protein